MRTPLTIVTGPLGSGKTTLLRRILDTTDQRLAIIMNEFGEIAVDSKVIEGKHVRVAELAGGCVCCSLSGEFEAAVTELLDTVEPEHIVVETTGVAEPEGLILDVEDNLPQVRLDGVIVIADADAVARFPQLGRTFQAQLEQADLILLNKIDLVEPGRLEDLEHTVRGINQRAPLLRTVRCEVEPTVLLGLDVRRPPQDLGTAAAGSARTSARSPAPHRPAVDVISFTTERPLDRARFEREVRDRLAPAVYRAKGFVRFGDGDFLFNYVAGRWDFEPWTVQPRTELVLIGQGLAAVKDALLTRLRACELPEARR
jgi:G3E family GTPase